MADLPEFQRRQYELAAHIRDPERNPAPAGITDRRAAIYRDLFFNNVSSLLATTFKVTKKILERDRWNALVREFLARHRSHTPYFLELPKEFLEFLAERSGHGDGPPFLEELAHYEWVELGLSIAEIEPELAGVDRAGNLLDGTPVVSPLAWLLGYEFPVHRISRNYQPQAPGEQPTWLVVYRRINYDVGFLELNSATARLFELVRDNEQGRCGRQLLETVAQEIGHPQPESVIAAGHETLEKMLAMDIVLGTIGGVAPEKTATDRDPKGTKEGASTP